jgi:hypothetical protein
MRLFPVILAGLALAASPVLSASVRDCETFEANARNLIFPIADNIKTFANGDIRLIGLDTGGEPVCCSSHLMVLLPSPEDPGDLCVLVSDAEGRGWSAIAVGRTKARYDAEVGLTVTVPVSVYNGSGSDPGSVTLVINQPRGTVIPQ